MEHQLGSLKHNVYLIFSCFLEGNKNRRPSLERQTTLYDDQYYADSYYTPRDQRIYSEDNRYKTKINYPKDNKYYKPGVHVS